MRINPALNGRLTVVAEGRVSSPDVSADGEVVVYNQLVDGFTGVFRHEDGESVKLTTDGHASMKAAVSGDGSRVAFTRYNRLDPNEPGNWDLALWTEGEGEAELIADGPGNEMSALISDDGLTVVFDDDGDGNLGRGNIRKWVDGQLIDVTTGDDYNLFPKMSGDGRRITWRRYEGGKSEIWMQDQNGVVKPFLSGKESLAVNGMSHDGTKVLYVDGSQGDEDLVLHDESNRSETLVAGERKVDETWASMSSDGGTIAWTNFDFRKGAPADTSIYMQVDGESIRVTESDGGLNSDPEVSADGKTLVWMWIDAEETANRKIYKLDLD